VSVKAIVIEDDDFTRVTLANALHSPEIEVVGTARNGRGAVDLLAKERVNPGTAQREAATLRAQGASVHVSIANPDPQTDFMSAATVSSALEIGMTAGRAEAPLVAKILAH